MTPLSASTFAWKMRAINRYGAGPFLCVLMSVAFSIYAPGFATLANLRNILSQASLNCMLAIGMTVVMLLSGIDLSVGSIVALASVTFALFMPTGLTVGPLIALTLVLCSMVGILSGAAVVLFRLPPFIATLATMSIARGLALTVTDGASVSVLPSEISTLRQFENSTLPLSVSVALLMTITGQILLRHTTWGTYIYAIGDSPLAAARHAINTRRLTLCAYGASAAFASLAGIFLTIRLSSAQPIYGYMYELDAIAAAVVGGLA